MQWARPISPPYSQQEISNSVELPNPRLDKKRLFGFSKYRLERFKCIVKHSFVYRVYVCRINLGLYRWQIMLVALYLSIFLYSYKISVDRLVVHLF